MGVRVRGRPDAAGGRSGTFPQPGCCSGPPKPAAGASGARGVPPSANGPRPGGSWAMAAGHRLLGGGEFAEITGKGSAPHPEHTAAARGQARADHLQGGAGRGGEAQRPMSGERVERAERRLGVRRLDQGPVRRGPHVLQLGRLLALALPLRLREAYGVEAGHLEPAGGVREGGRLADVRQGRPVVPGPRRPRDLCQVVRLAADQGQGLEGVRSADTPLPFEPPGADPHRLAVRQRRADRCVEQRLGAVGSDGDGIEAARRHGPERGGEAAVRRDVG